MQVFQRTVYGFVTWPEFETMSHPLLRIHRRRILLVTAFFVAAMSVLAIWHVQSHGLSPDLSCPVCVYSSTAGNALAPDVVQVTITPQREAVIASASFTPNLWFPLFHTSRDPPSPYS
ncbi:MAG TPA: hypothetical protein ENI98_13430 [Gammaproteobacteria bacterium]|nr:hypothetical protein [Gammaproteobacteria bacterium]